MYNGKDPDGSSHGGASFVTGLPSAKVGLMMLGKSAFDGSTRSLGNAAKDACQVILNQ
jgi:hypothetical protein